MRFRDLAHDEERRHRPAVGELVQDASGRVLHAECVVGARRGRDAEAAGGLDPVVLLHVEAEHDGRRYRSRRRGHADADPVRPAVRGGNRLLE